VRILMREVENAEQKIQPLFVSVDPKRDTPKVLAEYVKYFHPSVIGLTGSEEEIDRVVKQYRAHYRLMDEGDSEGQAYTVDHTAHLFIIGPQGKLDRIVPYGLPMDQLREAVAAALALEDKDDGAAQSEIEESAKARG